MSKRLTRKQIKEDIRNDEFSSVMSSGFEQIQENLNLIIGCVVGVVVLAIGFAATRSYLASQDQAAANKLSEAMRIYAAPIQEEAKPDDPKEPSFATEDDRVARAKEALGAVSRGAAGELASLYMADMALKAGDKETARGHWRDYLADHKDDILAVSVRLNMIQLDREDGKANEVADELMAQLEADDKPLPEEAILFELAQTLDTLDRGDEAKEYYQRIVDDFPQSPYSSKARQKTTS